MNSQQDSLITVRFSRGGFEVSDRTFALEEARQVSIGEAVEESGITAAMSVPSEIFVSKEGGQEEIAVLNESEALERVLGAVSPDGQILGGIYTVDVTVEHRGAA